MLGLMTDATALFTVLRQSADTDIAGRYRAVS